MVCSKCGIDKPEEDFYRRSGRPKGRESACKECKNHPVADWRRRVKERLIALHGGKCSDCGRIGPPYQMEFDHREPDEKKFAISSYHLGFDKLLEESLKCDLVCCWCHNERTHRQVCRGCKYCSG